jgi:hypothetical protein
MVHYSNLIKDSVLDKDLQEYYEARFDMMSTKGWKDLLADIEVMTNERDSLMATKSLDELNFRKGQLDVLHWIRTLKQLSEEAWEQLNNDQKDI